MQRHLFHKRIVIFVKRNEILLNAWPIREIEKQLANPKITQTKYQFVCTHTSPLGDPKVV